MSPGTTKAPEGCEPSARKPLAIDDPCRVSSLRCARTDRGARQDLPHLLAFAPGDDDDLVDAAGEERVGRVRDERPAAELGEQLVSAPNRVEAPAASSTAPMRPSQAPRRVLTISARIETAISAGPCAPMARPTGA